MLEGISDTMNLDLNLGPSSETEPQLLSDSEEWVDEPSAPSEPVWGPTSCSRQQSTRQQLALIGRNRIRRSSASGNLLQTGEGSTAAEERTDGGFRTCENAYRIVGSDVSDKKVDVETDRGDDGSFFDCNICLEMSKEPVVTCCGHLFCWPCLFQWLHCHSEAKECPVCKGEVTSKTVIPVYGRGTARRGADEDLDAKIPARPPAQRFESLRQTLHRTPLFPPMEDTIRRIQDRLDRESTPFPSFSNFGPTESRDRADSLLNRFLSSHGRGVEENPVSADTYDIDLAQTSSIDLATMTPRYHMILQSHRPASIPPLSSARTSTEQAVSEFFRRNREQYLGLPPNDRDSFSSLADLINLERQVNANVEIDALVPPTTSTLGRRNESASRDSNMDSADSRAYRRRRFR